MKRQLFGPGGDKSGAVAATVGLSLFALVAAGGIAFDYARLATLDTEMQNAADQAALAAATQLDKEPGAIARATAAAQGLLANQTLLANDNNAANMSINVPTVLFYATKADAEAANATNCPTANAIAPGATGADAAAKFVCVRTMDRVANYALTPIAAAFRSNDVSAMAVAGLGSAICKIPPLMMCNPQEDDGELSPNMNNYAGFGLRLVEGGGGSWTPGNFGYLQTGLGNGANVLEYALGANVPPGDCLATDGVTTKPGENTSVTDGINTRFDIYENGLTNACTGGTCSPALNVRKDVIRPDASTNFGFKTGSDPWDLVAVDYQYLPAPATGLESAPWPLSMGHPRDVCHARDADGDGGVEYCAGGRMGTGIWDRSLYFYVNYGPPRGVGALYATTDSGVPDANWQSIASLATFAANNGITLNNITRYQVYQWEMAADVLGPYSFSYTDPNPPGKTVTRFNYGEPVAPHVGLGAGPTQLDRRLSTVAVVNCTQQSVQGQAKDVTVAKWVEIFFVEPSVDRPRTTKGDIYVEIVRETTAGGNAPTNPQVVRRDVPYLIK